MNPRYVLALSLLGVSALGQSVGGKSSGSHRVEVKLERQKGGDWPAVDPALVFSTGDRVRFRLRTNFNGYLYVMNHGTSGDYVQLFPRGDTGDQNKIEANREYMIPATEGYFRLAGPPGHDVVYWIVSPIELRATDGETTSTKYIPLPPPPAPDGKLPPHLIPRCDDAVFRARGECLDNRAGPRKIDEKTQLPKNLKGVPNATPRDLMFIRERENAVISSPTPLDGPLIYEFRIAHK